jgi:hypothetical protein
LGFLGARFLKSSSRASSYNPSQQSGADFNCPGCDLQLLPADYERGDARCPRCGTSIGLREYYRSQAGVSTTVGADAGSDFGTGGGYTSSGSMAVGAETGAIGSAGPSKDNSFSMSAGVDAGTSGTMMGQGEGATDLGGSAPDETTDATTEDQPIRITPYLPSTEV